MNKYHQNTAKAREAAGKRQSGFYSDASGSGYYKSSSKDGRSKGLGSPTRSTYAEKTERSGNKWTTDKADNMPKVHRGGGYSRSRGLLID